MYLTLAMKIMLKDVLVSLGKLCESLIMYVREQCDNTKETRNIYLSTLDQWTVKQTPHSSILSKEELKKLNTCNRSG